MRNSSVLCVWCADEIVCSHPVRAPGILWRRRRPRAQVMRASLSYRFSYVHGGMHARLRPPTHSDVRSICNNTVARAAEGWEKRARARAGVQFALMVGRVGKIVLKLHINGSLCGNGIRFARRLNSHHSHRSVCSRVHFSECAPRIARIDTPTHLGYSIMESLPDLARSHSV